MWVPGVKAGDLEGFGEVIGMRAADRARYFAAVRQRVIAEPAGVVDEAVGEDDAALDVHQREAARAQLVVRGCGDRIGHRQ